MSFVLQRAHETCIVAGVLGSHTITRWLPCVMNALCATTRAKEIVIQLVVPRRLFPIEYRHGSALEPDHDGRIGLVRENVSPETIQLPPKIVCVVESTFDIFPAIAPRFGDIGIRSDRGECDDCALICRVGSSDLIYRPLVRPEHLRSTMAPRIAEQALRRSWTALYHALYPHRSHAGRQSRWSFGPTAQLILDIESLVLRDIDISV